MNYIAIVRKHTSAIEEAYLKIGKAETREKVRDEIAGACSRMGLGFFKMEVPETVTTSRGAVSLVVEAPVSSGGVVGVELGGRAVESKERGFPIVSTTTVGGVTTVYPHDWEDQGEPGPGVTAEQLSANQSVAVETKEMDAPVEMVGGWPSVAEVVACGLSPNRRHNRGRLPDGRIVSVERGLALAWKDGHKFRCRLVRAGGAPLFRCLT